MQIRKLKSNVYKIVNNLKLQVKSEETKNVDMAFY
jgi:hypothetical protein